MNNADLPAMPGNLDPQDAAFLEEFNHKISVAGLARWNSGLTKREEFAKAAMQGLLASGAKADSNMAYTAWEAVDHMFSVQERTK